ncbi:unnamed protein product, partial [marine sediment metagenome]
SGNSIAVSNLLRLSEFTGNHSLKEKAEQTVKLYAAQIEKSPTAFAVLLSSFDFLWGKAKEIVIAGDRNSSSFSDMVKAIYDSYLPKSYRHMNGYTSHTYMWVNANGERFWVKYHFKTDQGIDFLTQEEADRIVGEDADYHRRDLSDAIKRRDYPSWTLKVQIMPFADAKTYRYNPFDLTKVWPHGDYPVHEVGRLTLTRNPTDFHTEIEQAAFEPNNLVPGIGPSPDRMLLARLISYADAHRARLGVNYKQIQVNRPKCPVHSYSKGGAMRMDNVSDPVYKPNSKGGPKADSERYPEQATWNASGEFMRVAYTLRKDDD